jgi:16S rRNA G966 N2-methylase RsmD
MKSANKKPQSDHAQVAALCKKYVRSMGLECRTSSDSFSMGNSVRVKVTNATGEQRKTITEHCSQYQYGHFDGMQDLYECNNTRKDIPQTKYLNCEFIYTPEWTQAAYEWVRDKFGRDEDQLPADYNEACRLNLRVWNEYVSTQVYRALNGSLDFYRTGQEERVNLWNDCEFFRPKPKLELVAPITECSSVVPVFHDKMGQQIYIVTFPHMEREQFEAMREAAKMAGGWYSRKWGASPAGFAFKSEAGAQAFASGGAIDTRQSTCAECGGTWSDPHGELGACPHCDGERATRQHIGDYNAARADKLDVIADKAEIDSKNKFADRLSNTPKRLAQSMSARIDGERLGRVSRAARSLAEKWRNGHTLSDNLKRYNNKAALWDALRAQLESVPNGFHSYSIDTGKPAADADLELWELSQGNTRNPYEFEKIKLKNRLQFADIPGYYPTPASVQERMTAMLSPHILAMRAPRVLEPSAGSGNLCSLARTLWPACEIHAVEVNHDLARLLELEGYPVVADNFMQVTLDPIFDVVLMNPPFEKLQDIYHVWKAYKALRVGGELIAITSPSWQYVQQDRAAAFRNWIDEIGAAVERLPAGSFKESGTAVEAVMISIVKTA